MLYIILPCVAKGPGWSIENDLKVESTLLEFIIIYLVASLKKTRWPLWIIVVPIYFYGSLGETNIFSVDLYPKKA